MAISTLRLIFNSNVVGLRAWPTWLRLAVQASAAVVPLLFCPTPLQAQQIIPGGTATVTLQSDYNGQSEFLLPAGNAINAGGYGVVGDNSQNWIFNNQGSIAAGASSTGSGLKLGSSTRGLAQVVNSGRIVSSWNGGNGPSGVQFTNGGSVFNRSSGYIEGYDGVHTDHGSILVENAGVIYGNSGGGTAVYSGEGATVTNLVNGQILGKNYGVSANGFNRDAVISNYGKISTGSRAVYLYHGVVYAVYNAPGAEISSGGGQAIRIEGATGYLLNEGNILAQNTALYSNNSGGGNVYVNAGVIEADNGYAIQISAADNGSAIYNLSTLTGSSGAVRIDGSDTRLVLGQSTYLAQLGRVVTGPGSQLNGDAISAGLNNAVLLTESGFEDSALLGFKSLSMNGVDWTLSHALSLTDALQVQKGRLDLTNDLDITGPGRGVIITDGGALNMAGNMNILASRGGVAIGEAGVLDMVGNMSIAATRGEVSIGRAGKLDLSGNMRINAPESKVAIGDGGTLNMTGNLHMVADKGEVSIGRAGSLDMAGDMDITASESIVSIGNDGKLRLTGNMNLVAAKTEVTVGGGGRLDMLGNMRVNSSDSKVAIGDGGTLNMTGNLHMVADKGEVSIGRAGSLDMAGDMDITASESIVSIGNDGKLRLAGNMNIAADNGKVVVGNNGTLDLSGNLRLAASQGGVSIGSGAMFKMSGNMNLAIPGGVVAMGDGGALSLTGNLNMTAPGGQVNVGNGGVLSLADSSAITLSNPGSLALNGGALINLGMHSRFDDGNSGNVLLAKGAVMVFNVGVLSDSSALAAARLSTGTADIRGKMVARITNLSHLYQNRIDPTTVLAAAAGITVASSTELLGRTPFYAYEFFRLNSREMVLRILPGGHFSDFASSPNTRSLARALDRGLAQGDKVSGELRRALLDMVNFSTSPEDTARRLRELSPAILAGGLTVSPLAAGLVRDNLQNMFWQSNGQAGEFSTQAVTGAAPAAGNGFEIGEWRFRLSSLGGWHHGDGVEADPGYDAWQGGGMLTGARTFGDFTFGAAFAAIHTRMDWQQFDGRTEGDSLAGALFASFERQGWFVAADAVWGTTDVDSQRDLTSQGLTATADYRTHWYGGDVYAGYHWLTGAWEITPGLGASWYRFDSPAVTEDGAGTAGLRMGEDHMTSLELMARLDAAYTFRLDNGLFIRPRAFAGVAVETADTQAEPEMRLIDNAGLPSFTGYAPEQGRTAALGGLGVDVGLAEHLTLYGDVQTELRDHYQGYSGQVGISLSF